MFASRRGGRFLGRPRAAIIVKGLHPAMIEKRLYRKHISGSIAGAFILAALIWIPGKLTARTAPVAKTPAQDTVAAKQKTAAEAYKNIQVLKDIPAEQLLPSMRYMA